MKTLLTFLFVAFSQVASWAQVTTAPVVPVAPVVPITPVVPQRAMPAQNMAVPAAAAAAAAPAARPAPGIVAPPPPYTPALEAHAHAHGDCDCTSFPYKPYGCDPGRCHAAMLRCASRADLVKRLNLSGTLADKVTRLVSGTDDFEYIQQIQNSLSTAEYNAINQSINGLGEQDRAYLYNRCR